MPKFKCHSCGKTDSTHVKDIGKSILYMTYGPLDNEGLAQFYIFCIECGVVNVYQPRLFFRSKFSGLKKDIPALIDELTFLDSKDVPLVPKYVLEETTSGMLELLNLHQAKNINKLVR